jgi:hypothetical protein
MGEVPKYQNMKKGTKIPPKKFMILKYPQNFLKVINITPPQNYLF